MVLLKPVVLLIVFGAAVVFVLFGFGGLSQWWNRRLEGYVSWVLDAYKSIGEPVEPAWVQRTITLSIFGPLAAFVAVGAWPIGLLAAAVGGAGLYAWVRYRRYVHRTTMDNQLVDVLVLMANSLKAGLSLQQAIELAATESRKPIVTEFEKVLKEIQLGQSVDHALLGMSERVGLPDLEIAVHSIVTLRETGGNLSETFMTVAQTIIERKKVEGKIAALTAQGVYQGLAMCAMPFLMGAIFYFMDPEYMRYMMTTALGWALWVLVFILDALGMWMIVKIVRIDV
jgi:tight adherence protein B